MALASPQEHGLPASTIDHDGLTAQAPASLDQELEQEQEQVAGESGQFLAKWTLKILSGVHLGAEIPLYQGSTRLGKGEDNDIVLSGDNLPDHLLTLVCSEDEVFVEGLSDQQANYLAGKSLSLEEKAVEQQAVKVPVKPFEVLTLGLLHLVYGPKNETWPEVELPQLQQEQPEQDPESVEDEQNAEAPEQMQQDEVNPESKKTRSSVVLPSLVLGMTLACGGMFLGFSSPGSSEPAPLSLAEQGLHAQQSLQQQLTAAGLEQLHFKKQNLSLGKALVLEGFVADNKQQEQLQQLIAGAGYPVKMNIRVLSQLFNNLSYLLKVLGYPNLTVHYGEQAGDFVIGGYLSDNSRWQNLKSKLERDVAGLGHISANFDTLASRATWLRNRLSQDGLDNLALAKQASAIVVSGEIAAGSLASWQQIEQEFKQRYLGLPKLEFSAQRIEKTLQEIKGVSLGAVPYITTADGKRVITGGKLAGGYLIESIGPDRVVLSKAGKAMIYLIGGQHNE
ncbi:type III secretion system inner membrane ring subunit SctD [Thalassomonas actiniarum]|uniref:Type III secretion system inner membrane ring subunit SctD n=1 Tax=Thalassomonas actiniarum TaxID=485447 RepID=A0AAE9YH62_9GAMM|nr:type III secretion system inner membrane ring subunit SctD [Thalassomonas actiniarum]WDD96619.1 type III secretion system inner membrane ring subunit SctD [Thalassomonas actiniarum]